MVSFSSQLLKSEGDTLVRKMKMAVSVRTVYVRL